MLLAPRKVLVVLIADTGKVEQRVIDVGQDLADDALGGLRTRFLATPVRNAAEPAAAGCCPPSSPAGPPARRRPPRRWPTAWKPWPQQP